MDIIPTASTLPFPAPRMTFQMGNAADNVFAVLGNNNMANVLQQASVCGGGSGGVPLTGSGRWGGQANLRLDLVGGVCMGRSGWIYLWVGLGGSGRI